MTSTKTITINGRQYDAVTGLPVASKPEPRPVAPANSRTSAAPTRKAAPAATSKPATPKAPVAKKPAASRGPEKAAKAVHSSGQQRSQTLRRTAVKKPVAPAKVTRRPRTAGTRHMDIARSTQVTKFAPHPEAAAAKVAKVAPAATAAHVRPAATPKPRKTTTDAPATSHPMATRALAKRPRTASSAAAKPATTAKEIKEAQIKKALAQKTAPEKKSVKKNAPLTPWKKRTIILTVIAIVALVGVVAATHIFPSLSVQVASMRAGVGALYPKYIPDGYSLSQPITHGDNRVAITFKSNSNSTHYTLTQAQSSWDSTAVLDNLVKKEAQNNYVTTRERGLTIYTYTTHAAWVNGGILYTIEGDADLSGDQIRKIATSL